MSLRALPITGWRVQIQKVREGDLNACPDVTTDQLEQLLDRIAALESKLVECRKLLEESTGPHVQVNGAPEDGLDDWQARTLELLATLPSAPDQQGGRG